MKKEIISAMFDYFELIQLLYGKSYLKLSQYSFEIRFGRVCLAQLHHTKFVVGNFCIDVRYDLKIND